MTDWSADDIPDQTGRVFVVTGASSGIGLAAATELACKGAHVVLACRNRAKAEQVARDMPGSHEVRDLDLADLDSVRAFADGVSDWRIETLVDNAGIMNVPLRRTPQGHESQLATNVLGHFLLTNLLLPRLTDRVVWVTSTAHHLGGIRLDDLDFERRRYNGWVAYGQSKLGDLLLAYELQRRLTGAGSHLRSVAAHPGYAATNLQQQSGTWQDTVSGALNKLPFLAQSADEGALPTLYAATVPDLPGGSLVGPGGFLQQRGAPRTVGSSRVSHDRDLAAAFWSRCEELTGGPFTV